LDLLSVPLPKMNDMTEAAKRKITEKISVSSPREI
jgi:hypothetical protein